ncbi:N-acetylglucosamine kinase [Nonomuraea lactucae]|uniref:N-acetylglucosamine kinase n=1 Tax=Nonomuraea lactucae TaxID=2249762 RepID=UPI000DE47A7B|nr:BadF/BadG/BcrA/BcrD ATPase family protein [Nonomuraea lactucae]
MRTVLAIDGGNSKTDVALVSEDGSVLATGRGAGFRPQTTGMHVALDVVRDVVRGALGSAAAPPYADHVAAYLAGADLPVEEDALRDELLARRYGRDAVVGNDTFALLRAGTSKPWGVAVVCGAGMNAVGVSPTGEVARFPALGRLSGDWGGGLGLGEETLWHAVRAEDGRGPATALARAVCDHFGARTVEEVVLGVHFGDLSHAVLLDLVPVLLSVATARDPVARSIVVRLADEVTTMAVVALDRLRLLDTPVEVILGGGVLTARDPLLGGLIEQRFTERAPRAELIVADTPPIVGAALLGLEQLGASEAAMSRLHSGCRTW